MLFLLRSMKLELLLSPLLCQYVTEHGVAGSNRQY